MEVMRSGRHRVILCATTATDVYANMLMKHSTSDSKPGGKIKVASASFDAFATLMTYLYTGAIVSEGQEESSLPSGLLAEVFVLAERYVVRSFLP